MSDEQPGDVRDTLSGLERRLREIEGDLRSGAAEPGAEKAAAAGSGKDDSGSGGGDARRPSALLIAGLGAAALDLAYVAAGRFDGFWEMGLAPWDMAAGALLVQEAGGLVGGFGGDGDYLESGEIVAGSPKVFAQLLALVASV